MKRYLFIIIIVCLFSISAVSAEEISNEANVMENTISAVSAEEISNEANVMENSHDSDSIAESVDGNNLLTEDTGSFSELQTLINNASSGDTIVLDKDYVAESAGRITISKDIVIIINGNGHSIDAKGKSGIFNIIDGYVTLNNVTLKNGNQDNGGAITVHQTTSSLKLNHVKFLNNHAIDSGGAIYFDAPQTYEYTTLTDCYFENNTAEKLFGGAIYYNTRFNMQVYNCTFKSNKCNGGHQGYGGAIFSRTEMNIKGCAFIDNFVYNCGGAIYSTEWSEIINCNFTNNRAGYDDGGAIYSQENLNLQNCNFNNNLAHDNGGAIYIAHNNGESIYSIKPSIINCNFTNNNATSDDGGAIYSRDELKIQNCNFIKNHADEYGGAIYSIDCVDVENSIFTSNHVHEQGGAIYSKKSVNTKDSKFEKNNATDGSPNFSQGGGAIRALENVKVVKSSFSDCSAKDIGGAVYASGHVIVVSSYFGNNKVRSQRGGAIYAKDYVEVENSDFTGNHARIDGGGLYCEQSVSIKNSTFNRNTLDDDVIEISSCGGAIYAKYDVKVDNCTFLYNQALSYGGAIYSDSVTWIASPSYFIGNQVMDAREGGAIYTNKFTTDVKYGVFIKNGVASIQCWYGDGGAIYINKETHITFSQCYFENNYAKRGSAIYLDSRSSTLTIKDNIFIADNPYQKQPVYNSGTYGEIKNNWYRALDPDFTNMFKEWKLFSDVSHSDSDYLVTKLSLSENPRVGQTYTLTFEFISIHSGEPTGELFGWSVKFNADNDALISNYKIGTNNVTAEITFMNEGLTNITADILGETLELSFSPTKENVAMNITAPEISWGENATAKIIFTPNTATGTVTVGSISATIVNGTATVIIPNLPVGNNTLPVEYSGDWAYKNMTTSVVIVVKRKDLNISASAIPIYIGDNATVVVMGLENATGNVTVSINNRNWSGKITEGICNVIIPGINENTTATVTYPGNNNYNNASTTVNIIVNTDSKKNLNNMAASADPINIPNDATVVVSGLENATGDVNVVIGDKNWSGEISDGVATVIVTGLTGNVTANVIYAGDYKYRNASTTVNIAVYPPITVWYVDGSRTSSGDGKSKSTAFKTLREAINNAPEGSTIYIMPNTYVGDDNVGLNIDKNLNLVKLGDGEVILDAQGLQRILNVNAQSLNITGITFKNGKDEYAGGAILFNQTLENSIINAVFINNTATEHGGGAIAFNSDLNNSIIDSIFINNTASYGDGGAIYFNGNLNNVTIKGNYNNNSAEDGGVFYFYGNLTDVNLSGDYADNAAEEGAVIFCEGDIANSNISGDYNKNHAIMGINVILMGYNVDISGNYVNNTVEKSSVLYIICLDDSIIHDSIFINNNIGDEPIITVLIESISASNNWFGNNATNYKTPNVSQNLRLINWLFLNATANPDEIEVNQSSTITFKLYSYDAASGTTSEYDASRMNIELDLTQTIGELNQKTVLLGDEITYTARQTGNASVTGKLGNVSYTIYLKNNGIPAAIYVTNSTLELKVNDTFDIVATTYPEGLAVTYNSSNVSVATVDADGKVFAVGTGSAVITVSVGGDGTYALNSTAVNVHVKKDLNISAYSIGISGNVILIMVGFENATGNVTITVGENNYNASIMWGMAFVSIPQVAENITAYIYYPGDDNYCNASTTINITAKKGLNITISANPIHVGENATVIVTGLENAVGNVSVIAGSAFKNAAIVNGTATATISGLNKTTTIYVIFIGDDNYNIGFASANITVLPPKQKLNISASADPIFIGGNATVIVTGLENATGNVSVRAGDEIYFGFIVNGTAKVVIPGLTESVIAYVDYEGDENYVASNTTVTVTVNKINTQLSANAVTTTYNINKNLVITLKDANGKVLRDVKVTVNLNGVKTYTTDKNGQVKINVAKLVPKIYTAKITFNGNDIYAKSAKNVKVTVKKAKAKIVAKKKTFKSKKKVKKYRITLKNNKGKAIKKVRVTLKIKKKTFKAKTNANGKAVFKIKKLTKKGKYTAKITFKGNKYYKKVTKKVKIKIK